jgi:hypothetical protein
MTKVSEEQVQMIFDFTEQKYIKYYDVQLELVDHIADKIEALQADDPNLSFDRALHKVYKSFGVYGFTKVQEEKVRQMEKFWRNRFWSYYMSYFKLPKIILTILLSILFYGLIMAGSAYMSSGLAFYFLALVLLILFILDNYKMRRHNHKRMKSKLLVIHSYASTVQGYFSGSVILSCNAPNLFSERLSDLPLWGIIAVSVLLSFMVINHHALNYVFPLWLTEEIQERYAHLDDEELRLATLP